MRSLTGIVVVGWGVGCIVGAGWGMRNDDDYVLNTTPGFRKHV